jgi:hypothetical protein
MPVSSLSNKENIMVTNFNHPIIDTKHLIAQHDEEKIFFGSYSGFQRYDSPKYKFAVTQEEKQRNSFWNPNEISMTNDAQKFFADPSSVVRFGHPP